MRARAFVLLAAVALSACSSSAATDTGTDRRDGTAVVGNDVPATVVSTTTIVAASDTTVPAVTTTTSADAAAAETSAPLESAPDTASNTDSSAGTVSADDDAATADRPFDVYTPSSYDGTTAFPLVVLLHGYTASGDLQESYFQLQPLAEERGFLYVHPDGTADARGYQFWNATDACCDLGGAGVDDVAYLGAVIAQVQAQFEVDPKRIFLVGHSNGGFMSYRMACERADLVAAVASVAGATFADEGECAPSEPVSVLQVHGTDDQTIGYDGGQILGHTFPSAVQTVSTWAQYDGCGDDAEPGTTELDLEATIDGDESTTLSFPDCPDGRAVTLWTIDGGSHVPALSATFMPDVIDFLFAHPKP